MEGIAILENASVYVTIAYDANKGAYLVGAYPKEGVKLDYISAGSWEISLNDALKAANDYIISTL